MEDAPAEWFAAAKLLRPQGRRGELLADPLSDLPDLFKPGMTVSVAGSPDFAPGVQTTLESFWLPTGRNAGRFVLKLTGCDTISDAERLAGRDLLIRSADLPPLAADTWFVRDLLGCTLFDGPTSIGEITGIEYPIAADGKTRLADAAPLLEVSVPGRSEPVLIPFVKAWLDAVDLDQHRVNMNLPAGLLTLDTEPETQQTPAAGS
jgi:16S rRNA processing protein RimM